MQRPGRTWALPVALLAIAVLLSPADSGTAAPAPPVTLDRLLDRGIAELHAGLHDRAEAAFLEAARLDPVDPEPHALRALSLWWRILGDRQDRSFDAGFHAAVDDALRAAGVPGAAKEAPPGVTPHQRAWIGTALVLRFHIRGLRREFRDAARDARLGHELLDQAVAADPAELDPLFALGAYNYFADSLPALARGLRVLMRVPPGDLEGGLGQLRRLAGSRSRLALHARLLLALVEASDTRRCYERARADLDAARGQHPGSPLVHATAGAIALRLGFHDEAARAFAAAMETAGGTGESSVRLRRSIALRLAETRVADWRLAEAVAILEPIRGTVTEPRDRQALQRLDEEIAYRRGHAGAAGSPPPASAFAARLGEGLEARTRSEPDAAIAAWRAAAAIDPSHPLPHLLIGESLLDRRRAAEALEALEGAAARAGEAPPWVAGWTEIDRGLALRALGRTRQARARFERAGETRRFRSADRGLYEIEALDGTGGRCADPPGGAAAVSATRSPGSG